MNQKYRTERDSLGEVRLPAEALYGAQTQRAVENFPISGLRPWRAFIWSMAVIKQAAAEVNRDLGLLDPERAEATPGSAAIFNACLLHYRPVRPPVNWPRSHRAEHEILGLLSKGQLAKEIADTLGISVWTCKAT